MRQPFCSLFIAFLLSFSDCFADSKETVEVRFEDMDEDDAADSYIFVERLFKNPALASGLSSGTDALNKSLDSLFEVLFYNLMDRDISLDLTDNSSFTLGVSRNIHNTRDGYVVVVDRFSLGPEFSKQVSSIYKSPIVFGSEGKASVHNIYLSSYSIRQGQEESLPTWRQLANNWFGALPTLASIMPPSFDSNQMYDPLKELETPFIFPFHPESALEMPIGSIRSYAIAGSVNITTDLAKIKSHESSISQLWMPQNQLTIPVTFSKTGDHRINILRRSVWEAWVGLSESSKAGIGFSLAASKAYRLFAKITRFWRGLPALFLPIDSSKFQSDDIRTDQLYSFDLRQKRAREAYASAVKGDFSLAWIIQHDGVKSGETLGVEYHFTRDLRSTDDNLTSNRNLFLIRNTRNSSTSFAEIETKAGNARYYNLEATASIRDESWDILTGQSVSSFASRLDLSVTPTDKTTSGSRYILDGAKIDPISSILSLNIEDKYTDASELKSHMLELTGFSALDNPYATDIPDVEPGLQEQRAQKQFFADPLRSALAPSEIPTYLGEFSANAAIEFGTMQLHTIIDQSIDDQWEAIRQAFYLPAQPLPAEQSWWSIAIKELPHYLTLPLKLSNYRLSDADAYYEARRSLDSLQNISLSAAPEDLQRTFGELFKTDYPERLARALLNLAKNDAVPRSVSLFAKPKGGAGQAAKKAFSNLDRRVYRSKAKTSAPPRSRIITEKLLSFNPAALRENRPRPSIIKVIIDNTSAYDEEKDDPFQPLSQKLIVQLTAKRISSDVRAYVRIEDAGSLNMGRFVLAEKVITLKQGISFKSGESHLSFTLTGTEAVLDNFLFQLAIDNGGKFDITLSISGPDDVWSEERRASFRYDKGRLRPI